ncbi:MAG: hypothetical protein VKJ24_08740 [Synechococcales bacterium]|nr:hypothetical protein [Synechococcales bacterium]
MGQSRQSKSKSNVKAASQASNAASAPTSADGTGTATAPQPSPSPAPPFPLSPISASQLPTAQLAETTDPAIAPPEVKPDYAAKTARIQAIAQLIKNIQPLIWATVLAIVLIPLAGKYLIDQSLLSRPGMATVAPVQEVAIAAPDWSEVDQAIAAALKESHQVAQTYASAELDRWEAELEPRIEGFLDWYFEFFNQKKMEFSTPFVWGYAALRHRLDPTQPKGETAIAHHLARTFEQEFAKRVLVPKNAQLRLEVITNETVSRYLAALDNHVGAVQTKYHLPQAQWERYLQDISLTLGSEGSLSHLSLKTLVGGSTYLAAKPLVLTSLGKLSGKATAKLAGGAVTKVAAKGGGAIAAELGAAILDPLVGIGIIAWDVWDYRHTVKTDRPVLQENLATYLKDMKQLLLNNPETGVMSAVREIEQTILAQL